MSEHKVILRWNRGDKPFEYQKYSRDHTWKFDGGHEMQASAAPAYLGNPNLADPEEAFVASLSSCHMLTFLAIACKKRFVLDEYIDDAVGVMEKNAEGRLAITRVTLRQRLKFSGDKQPTPQEIEDRTPGAIGQGFPHTVELVVGHNELRYALPRAEESSATLSSTLFQPVLTPVL